ncbi:LapA family protein [Pelovirga terrestris]|uniref:LapA family protein n=1 Tax=Pelovirga terrestris TaxID=2771352 RepID=A0A8J6QSQ1_9BACT|nr:LapA family protein [Pelovirga terrestris]MBD1401035.1 LapA family protein [Pelovirga terrestris]
MRTAKQILLIVLGALLAVVILQNTAPVRIQFLWFSGQISTVVLLFLTAVGGFAMGVIVALLLKGRGKDSDTASSQKR